MGVSPSCQFSQSTFRCARWMSKLLFIHPLAPLYLHAYPSSNPDRVKSGSQTGSIVATEDSPNARNKQGNCPIADKPETYTSQSSHDGSWPSTTGSAPSPPLTGTWPGQCVFGKCPRQGLLAADLLAADEAFNCNTDGPVNVLSRHIVCEAHPAECLADADDGFQVTNLKRVCQNCF